jgi:uncharacterized protein (DUF302 family)
MPRLPLAAAFAVLAALPAVADSADPPVTRVVDAAYDDVMFELETAITNAGLVIDRVNHVGEMLERTKTAVGGTRTIFTEANIFTFCSAEVSRAVMEADPLNLQYCPYRIFVSERPEAPGEVTVGHPRYPAGVMDQVNVLLDGIIAEALAGF